MIDHDKSGHSSLSIVLIGASSSVTRMTSTDTGAEGLRIRGYEHVGVRVSSTERAIAFYRDLGFDLVEHIPEAGAAELTTRDGATRINLIFNGRTDAAGYNILQDCSDKHPGLTHLALVVDSLDAAQVFLKERGIPVTEGPHPIGRRRVALFFRDPDGNVIELNEMLEVA